MTPVSGGRLVVVVGMVALFSAACASQDAGPQDVGDVLSEVAQTLGVPALQSLQYSGTGFTYSFGQGSHPNAPYPQFHATYSRSIDYERGLAREDTVRSQFEDPPSGGGGQPLYTDSPGGATVTENSDWNARALALTPHGFVRAAMAANPTMSSQGVGDQAMTVVSVTLRDQYRVDGYINAENLIQKIETWTPNPILGDTLIERTFSEYRDFGDVKVPMRFVQQQGGFPTLDPTVTDVEPNAVVEIEVPAPRAPQAARSDGEQVAEGVWYLSGAPGPNSQLVEFRDYTVIIESSVSESRALANIAEAKRLVPNKPIGYHVNSHHHGDHAAGVRAYVAEGATIITHEMNERFYEDVVLTNPHTLAPDTLSENPRPAEFVYVEDKYVLSDGERTLEVYHVPNGHAANLLMSYLPAEKLLLITDIFNDFGRPRPNDAPPGLVSPYNAALGDRIEELQLDVESIAPSHGTQIVSIDMLQGMLEGTVQAPPVRPMSAAGSPD